MSKIAVITGGTSGIGRETALYLAKNGCTVYELMRRIKLAWDPNLILNPGKVFNA